MMRESINILPLEYTSQRAQGYSVTNVMNAISFGHGNPSNGCCTMLTPRGWATIGRSIMRPKAVLCISAHWVLTWNRGDSLVGSANDLRFRRFSARTLPGSVSSSRKSGTWRVWETSWRCLQSGLIRVGASITEPGLCCVTSFLRQTFQWSNSALTRLGLQNFTAKSENGWHRYATKEFELRGMVEAIFSFRNPCALTNLPASASPLRGWRSPV